MKADKLILVLILVLGMIVLNSMVSFSINNRGPEKIIVNGGRMGNIDFPHRRHQDALKDCKACHSLFPKKVGIIAKMKKEGKLEEKQVMNRCRGCHRERANKGMKAGPTSCKKCHNKDLKLGAQ